MLHIVSGAADSADYDMDAVVPGEALPITVDLTNNGDSTLASVNVLIQDAEKNTICN